MEPITPANQERQPHLTNAEKTAKRQHVCEHLVVLPPIAAFNKIDQESGSQLGYYNHETRKCPECLKQISPRDRDYTRKQSAKETNGNSKSVVTDQTQAAVAPDATTQKQVPSDSITTSQKQAPDGSVVTDSRHPPDDSVVNDQRQVPGGLLGHQTTKQLPIQIIVEPRNDESLRCDCRQCQCFSGWCCMPCSIMIIIFIIVIWFCRRMLINHNDEDGSHETTLHPFPEDESYHTRLL